MEVGRRELFTTIRTEGAILPPDLLQRVAGGDNDFGGLKPADYHLIESEPLNEAIVRSWNRLVGAWAAFSDARAKLVEGDLGTTITRERWLLILFDELGYGRLQPARAIEIDSKSYAVSHSWGDHVPIHLVGCNVPLDRRSQGVAGAAAMSPHGLVQELLNRSEERLWGFVSNGLALRVLRDNSSLTRQAFVEFDLASMMDGDVYADFVVLWLVCHESRVEGSAPYECWLERWSQEAVKQGTRALDGLRNGVEAAITALGSGFLAHPANADLREKLRSGDLDQQDYYRELLRLVYRLLFLFVSEDRGLLLDPTATREAAEHYENYYSTTRLRRLAGRRRGSKHADLYQGLRIVMGKLGDDDGCPALGLPALGSYLWSTDALQNLSGADLANAALLDAVRALATLEERGVRRSVDYRNLGAEELGSVYESLLELHPELHVDAGTFGLTSAAGNERKTTGSYYTPTSLISCLLDSALDPVLDEAAAKGEQAILDLKVVDPACGSGHFLVAAAHRIAKRLASARTGDDEPSPEATRSALRDVVGNCLYGVDMNPMAVELCKVSLWLEALDPGKPLNFLDAHIKRGNSLLGTTRALIEGGIPDEAFKPLEGDDKDVSKFLRAQNKAERDGQLTLEDASAAVVDQLEADAAALEAAADDSVAALHEKERRFASLKSSEAYLQAKLTADAWCAAFVQHKAKRSSQVTTAVVRRLADGGSVANEVRAEIAAVADMFAFFHWDVEYPQVFRRSKAGFDCILGNPPWDRLQVEEKQFFASLDPEIASAPARKRKQLIGALVESDPSILALFEAKRYEVEGQSHLIRFSGRYNLAGQGNLASNSLFIELAAALVGTTGRTGLIVPSGIATQDNQKELFAFLVTSQRLVSLFDFENRERLFSEVHGQFRFCLLTFAGGRGRVDRGRFAFLLHDVSQLTEEDRVFSMSASDLEKFSPNTLSCPAFQGERDARIAGLLYEAGEIILREEPRVSAWGWQSWQMLNETHEANELRDWDPEWESHGLYRLYEAKLIHQFDHRYATYVRHDGSWATAAVTYAEKSDPTFEVVTRYCARDSLWRERVESRAGERRSWAIGYRLTTNATNERTAIFTVIPACAATVGLPLALTDESAEASLLLVANLNAMVFDFAARLRVGGTNLNHFIVHQLPVITPTAYHSGLGAALRDVVRDGALELLFTCKELTGFARDCGYRGEPFAWNEERRTAIRAGLDAIYLHLYGLDRTDAEYVLDTFPIVRRRDEQLFGEYLTKRLILEQYDALAAAVVNGRPYEIGLDPPPADPRVAHQSPSAVAVPSGQRD